MGRWLLLGLVIFIIKTYFCPVIIKKGSKRSLSCEFINIDNNNLPAAFPRVSAPIPDVRLLINSLEFITSA
jgi:hypothetical protein